jgi:PAS domain S-box-containing protein
MHARRPFTSFDFLAGGEMGALMRAHDWTTSPLGPLEDWPQSLKTVVSLMLTSKFPMFVAWGPKLAFLYNDGYRPIFGAKHPVALGLPFEEVWPEIWDDISPLVERALQGEATFHENLHLVMERNGYPEDTWYTFSYSPVRDETGQIAGMFCACTETTQKVLADNRLAFQLALEDRLRGLVDPQAMMLAAAEALGRHLGVARAGYGEIDETRGVVSVKNDWTDGSVGSLSGEVRLLDGFGPALSAALRAGRTLRVEDCHTDPRSAGEATAAVWASIETRSLLVAPLVKAGHLTAVMYLHEPEPRRWTDWELVLLEDVAERTWSAVERARAEAALNRHLLSESLRLRRLFEQAPGFIAVVRGPEHVFEIANAAYLQLVGHRDIIGKPVREALPEIEGQGLFERLDTVYARAEPYVGRDLQIFLQRMPDAPVEERFLDFIYQPIVDVDGAVSGVFVEGYDVTERQRAMIAMRESEEQFRTMADAFPQIAWTCRPDGSPDWFNARTYEFTALTPEQMLGEGWHVAIHPDDAEQAMATWMRAVETGEDLNSEFRIRRHDGTYRWFLTRATAFRSNRGDIVRWFGTCTDVQDHKDAEEHQQLLINELNHRVKNTLATVQSVATQTLRNAPSTAEARVAIERRLIALSRAHDVLTRESWEGAHLREIVQQAFEPFRSYGERRFHPRGPEVRLSPRMALALAMALHELATNAVKYGALSIPTGEVDLTWSVADRSTPTLQMKWEERGGPPVTPPAHRGFGSRLIERTLAQDLDGDVRIEFAPGGVVCTVEAPLA